MREDLPWLCCRNVMPSVADAKAFLRKTNADGVSVYSHLTEVLATLLDQKPDNALDVLEGVSLACKQKHYIPALAVVPQPPPELGSVSHGEHWHMANVAILPPPKAGEEPADLETDYIRGGACKCAPEVGP